MIKVEQTGHSDPLAFEVTIRDAAGETRHHVTMSRSDCAQLTNGSCSPECCVKAAFDFLLDREAKESILSRFDVSVIARYFPEFHHELPRYLASGSGARDGS